MHTRARALANLLLTGLLHTRARALVHLLLTGLLRTRARALVNLLPTGLLHTRARALVNMLLTRLLHTKARALVGLDRYRSTDGQCDNLRIRLLSAPPLTRARALDETIMRLLGRHCDSLPFL